METWKHGNMETWRNRDMGRHGDMETWKKRPGNIEIWKHGNINMETWKHDEMETWRHGHGYMETSNGKGKPRKFSLILLPFSHRANGSLSFVSLLTKKQTEVIRLQTD